MKTIKIFLASSEELKPERLAIADLITRFNYIWAEYDICLRLVKWEYLDSSMGAQHKQEDYNDYLRECDMCVVLYWTKFGMYTEIELETSYQLYTSESGLKQFSVMFKEGADITPTLQAFREKFESEHPELCHSFEDGSQLKAAFAEEIIECLRLKTEEEHEKLAKEVRKLQKLLAITEEDEPEYEDYVTELQTTKKKLAKNESLIPNLERTLQTN